MYPNISCGQDQKLQLPVPMDRSRWKPNNTEPAPNCPRCASFNTKFCYYNNYSLSQPRYFCKACRRYWTKGGFLRNVPVGGGCRKIRRPKTSRHHLNIYTRSFTGSNTCTTSQEGDDQSAVNKASGSDIDMALVFAKFLSSGDQDFHNEAANCLTPESVETRTDAPVAFDPITDSCDGAAGVPENFAEQGLMSGIELEWEGLLGGDEVVQDVFSWSDATTSSSSVSWQPPMMQLQDDDEDAQLPISSPTNLFSEGWSWSCFDFSNLQVFSSTP